MVLRTGFGTNTSTCTAGHYGLDPWERSLTIEGGPTWASRGGGHFIIIFNVDALYFQSVCPALY